MIEFYQYHNHYYYHYHYHFYHCYSPQVIIYRSGTGFGVMCFEFGGSGGIPALRAAEHSRTQAPREVFDVGWLHLTRVRPGDKSVAVDGWKRIRVHRFQGLGLKGCRFSHFRFRVTGVGFMSVPQGWGLLRGIGSCPRRCASTCLQNNSSGFSVRGKYV